MAFPARISSLCLEWRQCLLLSTLFISLYCAHPDDVIAAQPWIKRGVVIAPDFAGAAYSHFASGPCVVKLKDGRLRMYFWAAAGVLPWQGRHYVLGAEADPANPFDWELISDEPMLGPDPGSKVRDNGVALPLVIPRDDGPWLMYYSSLGSLNEELGISHRSARTGLAISHDGGLSWRVEQDVLLPTGAPGSYDAALTASVGALRIDGNNYVMWYSAGEKYARFGSRHHPVVHLGLARSPDGIHWEKHKEPVLRARLDSAAPYEVVVSKPAVLLIDGTYHMWLNAYSMAPGVTPGEQEYSYDDKETGYRIEYANSADGVHWRRFADQPVMPLTPGAFDSRQQSYPAVIEMGDQLWMFYAGNDLGKSGIGLATMDKKALSR